MERRLVRERHQEQRCGELKGMLKERPGLFSAQEKRAIKKEYEDFKRRMGLVVPSCFRLGDMVYPLCCGSIIRP